MEKPQAQTDAPRTEVGPVPRPPEGPAPGPQADGGRAIARELTLAYIGVAIGTIAIDRLTRSPGLGQYTHVAIALLFMATAIQLSQRAPGGLRAHGLELGGLLEPEPEGAGGPLLGLVDLAKALVRALPTAAREIGVALLVSAVVFPPFCLGFYLFHGPTHPFTFHPPPDAGNYLLAQLLVVALPEEALFRGYFQTRLTRLLGNRRRFLFARLSLTALVGQAALFALLHFLVDLNPVRLAVFFPALLFGWLRALRGGIGAAVALHAFSNLLSDVLVRGWL